MFETDASAFAALRAEGADLDARVAALDEASWSLPTPSPGWTVAQQIGHLTWTDRHAIIAATDPEGFFPQLMGGLEAAGGDVTTWVDGGAADYAARPKAELLAQWREGREQLAGALEALPQDAQLPWFGGPDLPQSPGMLAAARLMEWWAHGSDVAAAIGQEQSPTDRLKLVADVSVDNRDYAFTTHGREVPVEPVRVELVGPAGQSWAWGPADAENRVTGSAADFCALMTQRVHRADTGLSATGPVADAWLDVAQAYAGPPGGKRQPSQ